MTLRHRTSRQSGLLGCSRLAELADARDSAVTNWLATKVAFQNAEPDGLRYRNGAGKGGSDLASAATLSLLQRYQSFVQRRIRRDEEELFAMQARRRAQGEVPHLG